MFSLSTKKQAKNIRQTTNNDRYDRYYYYGQKLFNEEWFSYKRGIKRMHRFGGPSYIQYNDHGLISQESWHIHGKLTRTAYYSIFGSLHSIRQYGDSLKPTYVSYYSDGTIMEERWLDTEGRTIRPNGPACISYCHGGAIKTEVWTNEYGQVHRDPDPAIISYFPDGNIDEKKWVHHGKIIIR